MSWNNWAKFILMPWAFLLLACGTPQMTTLPPDKCHPATDLAQPKHLKRLPEVALANDDFYRLFLGERSDHATDVRDYNSLLNLCVDTGLPPEAFKVFSD